MPLRHRSSKARARFGPIIISVLLVSSLVSALVGVYTGAGASTTPNYQHIVLVVEENHSYSEIIGSSSAPYINSLANGGANFTQSFAVTHPSEPNYLALWSGSTQGLTDDTCPEDYGTVASLGGQLLAAGLSVKGYFESMPSDGYTGCSSGSYARKHNPVVDFSATADASHNQMFTEWPTDFTTLPRVSMVVPNQCDDMHDCSIATGDSWLQSQIGSYATWAKTHNSLLIVTFDEDDFTTVNQIPTVFYGANVISGNYSEQINHYNVLRTIEASLGLPGIVNAANVSPITDVFGSAPTSSPSPSPSATLTVPAAPTGVTAVAGNHLATVSWVPPISNGGTPILNYTVVASDGTTLSAPGTASSVTLKHLQNGVTYTFKVQAVNSIGPGAFSTLSNPVVPKPPNH
jgi:phosphatidylinositol-3-phosphatase